jgi:hypothetical protein
LTASGTYTIKDSWLTYKWDTVMVSPIEGNKGKLNDKFQKDKISSWRKSIKENTTVKLHDITKEGIVTGLGEDNHPSFRKVKSDEQIRKDIVGKWRALPSTIYDDSGLYEDLSIKPFIEFKSNGKFKFVDNVTFLETVSIEYIVEGKYEVRNSRIYYSFRPQDFSRRITESKDESENLRFLNEGFKMIQGLLLTDNGDEFYTIIDDELIITYKDFDEHNTVFFNLLLMFFKEK